MEFFSWFIYVGSNIFGLVPIYSLFKNGKVLGGLLIFVAIIMSTIMNITNTKYNILPIGMYKYSMIIKYVEKCIAHVAGIYGLYMFVIHPLKNIYQILMPLLGIGFLFGSDYVNLLQFGILQMLWHGCIYTTLYLLVDK